MVDLAKMQPLNPGRCVATPGVLRLFNGDMDAMAAAISVQVLDRLARRDWGDVCDEDAADNDSDAATLEGRVVAHYRIHPTPETSAEIWAVWYPYFAEYNGPHTTVLLPHEY